MHWIVPNGGSQVALPKVLKGFGEAGVLEVIEADASGAYRADYSVTLHEAVFVSHCAWGAYPFASISAGRQLMDLFRLMWASAWTATQIACCSGVKLICRAPAN